MCRLHCNMIMYYTQHTCDYNWVGTPKLLEYVSFNLCYVVLPSIFDTPYLILYGCIHVVQFCHGFVCPLQLFLLDTDSIIGQLLRCGISTSLASTISEYIQTHFLSL